MPIGINIIDVRTALEDVFKGCNVETPESMGSSAHAEVHFSDYEVRVILGWAGKVQKIHYRFMQKIDQPNKPMVKRRIQDLEVDGEEGLVAAIKETKAHLLGVVFAIQRALKPMTSPRTADMDNIFNV